MAGEVKKAVELPTIHIKARAAAKVQPKDQAKSSPVGGVASQNTADATELARQNAQQLRQISDLARGAAGAVHQSAARFGKVFSDTIRSADQALNVLRTLYLQSPIKAAEELQKMALATLKPTKQGGVV